MDMMEFFKPIPKPPPPPVADAQQEELIKDASMNSSQRKRAKNKKDKKDAIKNDALKILSKKLKF